MTRDEQRRPGEPGKTLDQQIEGDHAYRDDHEPEPVESDGGGGFDRRDLNDLVDLDDRLGDDPNLPDAAHTLAAAGLLTEKQAAAWYLVDVLEFTRREVADTLAISVSVLDSHRQAAQAKISRARTTVEVVESILDDHDRDG